MLKSVLELSFFLKKKSNNYGVNIITLRKKMHKLYQQGWGYTKIHRHLLKIDLKLENIFANLCL
jgi:hypothetical protein